MTISSRQLCWVLLFPAILLLSGCQKKDTYEYYVLHPKQLAEAVQGCRNQPTPFASGSHCNVVYRAAESVIELERSLGNSQLGFGNALLKQQMQAASLKSQLSDAKQQGNLKQIEKLSKELAQVTLQINMRLAVLRVSMSL